MKNLLMTIFFLLSGILYAQLKIGNNPDVISASSILELESNDKAIIISRIDEVSSIIEPVNGMIVYDNNNRCLRVFQNSAWSNCIYSKEEQIDLIKSLKFGIKTISQNSELSINTYLPIVADDGRTWLNNNLKAHYSNKLKKQFVAANQALSKTDFNAYGGLFQFGRPDDGHEKLEWISSTKVSNLLTNTTSTQNDSPNHSNFITVNTDWRSNPYNLINNSSTITSFENGSIGSCPSGYAIPSEAEFQTLLTASNITNADSAFNSKLKLTLAGKRNYTSASLDDQAVNGYYWTRSVSNNPSDNKIKVLKITNTDVSFTAEERANGFSIRCIKI